MKTLQVLLLIFPLGLPSTIKKQDNTTSDKELFYQKKAMEDAKFEQEFVPDNEAEAIAFWEKQKNFEENLKKSDRTMYHIYMKSKREAYIIYKLDNDRLHSNHYYASLDYYEHIENECCHKRRPLIRKATKNRVGIYAPGIRHGVF